MNSFFNALLFYSRVPVPFKVECTPQILSRSLRYLPIVGLLVGACSWCIFWGASTFLTHQTSVVITMVAMVLLTGAFHEDGFADFCDGFGGGYGKEAILRIMKDSHIGCYGVIGLIMVFMLRYTMLISFEEGEQMAKVLVISQGASRFAPVLMVRTSRYARAENSKSSQSALGISGGGVLVAGVFALMPLFALGWEFALSYMAVAAVMFIIFRTYIYSQIDGFTGDTLGALQIIGELLFYATLLLSNVLW
ncbi:MAG: adenosylcobinamide-GDP ribazoletransferase [Rikenellaceae bacterium]